MENIELRKKASHLMASQMSLFNLMNKAIERCIVSDKIDSEYLSKEEKNCLKTNFDSFYELLLKLENVQKFDY